MLIFGSLGATGERGLGSDTRYPFSSEIRVGVRADGEGGPADFLRFSVLPPVPHTFLPLPVSGLPPMRCTPTSLFREAPILADVFSCRGFDTPS